MAHKGIEVKTLLNDDNSINDHETNNYINNCCREYDVNEDGYKFIRKDMKEKIEQERQERLTKKASLVRLAPDTKEQLDQLK